MVTSSVAIETDVDDAPTEYSFLSELISLYVRKTCTYT